MAETSKKVLYNLLSTMLTVLWSCRRPCSCTVPSTTPTCPRRSTRSTSTSSSRPATGWGCAAIPTPASSWTARPSS